MKGGRRCATCFGLQPDANLTKHPHARVSKNLPSIQVCSSCADIWHCQFGNLEQNPGNESEVCVLCGEGDLGYIHCSICRLTFCLGCIAGNVEKPWCDQIKQALALAGGKRNDEILPQWGCIVCKPVGVSTNPLVIQRVEYGQFSPRTYVNPYIWPSTVFSLSPPALVHAEGYVEVHGYVTDQASEIAHSNRKRKHAMTSHQPYLLAIDRSKKVICVSLFVADHAFHTSKGLRYLCGLCVWVDSLEDVWKGYHLRIYYDDSVRQVWPDRWRDLLCILKAHPQIELRRFRFPHLTDKHGIHYGYFGMVARYLSLTEADRDPDVKLYLFRDLDIQQSCSLDRTIMDEWESSNYAIHRYTCGPMDKYPFPLWGGGFSVKLRRPTLDSQSLQSSQGAYFPNFLGRLHRFCDKMMTLEGYQSIVAAIEHKDSTQGTVSQAFASLERHDATTAMQKGTKHQDANMCAAANVTSRLTSELRAEGDNKAQLQDQIPGGEIQGFSPFPYAWDQVFLESELYNSLTDKFSIMSTEVCMQSLHADGSRCPGKLKTFVEIFNPSQTSLEETCAISAALDFLDMWIASSSC